MEVETIKESLRQLIIDSDPTDEYNAINQYLRHITTISERCRQTELCHLGDILEENKDTREDDVKSFICSKMVTSVVIDDGTPGMALGCCSAMASLLIYRLNSGLDNEVFEIEKMLNELTRYILVLENCRMFDGNTTRSLVCSLTQALFNTLGNIDNDSYPDKVGFIFCCLLFLQITYVTKFFGKKFAGCVEL